MSAVNANEIELAYEATIRKHGESEGLRMFASILLESLISEQTAYSKAAERRATEAEEIHARVVGIELTNESDAGLFTGGTDDE